MGMTITEKILAKQAQKKHVRPGEIVEVQVDGVFSHDVFTPTVIEAFYKTGAVKLWDNKKVIFITDHELPAVSENSGANYQKMAQFAREHDIRHFYYGEGICHQVIPEQGNVAPGHIFIGTDSHTVTYGALTAFSTGIGSKEMANIWATGKIWLKVPGTIKFNFYNQLRPGVYSKDLILYTIGKMRADGCVYKAVEFSGTAITALSMDERFTITNMVVEMGAKNGIIPFDEKTKAYMDEKKINHYDVFQNDPDAEFEQVYNIDAAAITPQIAGPGGVDDVKDLSSIEGLKINQAYLGSCTNGRLTDLRVAAEILKGKKIAPYLKFIVTPASRAIFKEAMKEGLIDIFLDAGCVVTNPGCGLCYGALGGVLGKGEAAICSNNRNFPGRLGHKEARVYLASPEAVAVSALAGEIVSPSKLRTC